MTKTNKRKSGQWESEVVITKKTCYGDFGFTKQEIQKHIDSILERVEKEFGNNCDVEIVGSTFTED